MEITLGRTLRTDGRRLEITGVDFSDGEVPILPGPVPDLLQSLAKAVVLANQDQAPNYARMAIKALFSLNG